MNPNSLTLTGFGAYVRKEFREWWQRRAALTTFIVVAALGTIGTLSMRIDQLAGGVPDVADLQSTASVLGAKFEDWVLFASIFATIGIFIQERTTGTLAWTVSKPISRSAVLLAKWLVAVVVLGISTVVLPLAVSVAVATWSYGSLPDLAVVARFGLVLLAVPTFFVALDLAFATRLNSQAGVAAIAFAVFGAPYLIGGFLPAVAEAWPSSIGAMAGSVATGAAPNLVTVGVWAVAIVGLGVGAVVAFNREDL
jgi:ABC-type transport system involved in multi-copper enzyme maturation permease subunit